MITDLERRLSNELHRESVELVPDGPIPPAPPVAPGGRRLLGRAWVHRLGRTGARWQAPALAAAAVLAVAGTAVVLIQAHRDSGAVNAAAAPVTSPVKDAPAAAFRCVDTPTIHAALAGTFRIGVTATTFCLVLGDGTGGSTLRASGPLRSWVSTSTVAAGVVAPTVDRLTWMPAGPGRDGAAVGVDLYALGSLRGFAIPLTSGGTVVLYSNGSEVARQQIPYPGEGPAASSSMAASMPTAAPYPPGQTGTPGAWPTNAKGQTYGSGLDATADTGEPDLIAAWATNGRQGYVLRTDLDGPMPTSPSQAVAMNSAPPRTIPVYDSDGVTQIGVFVVGGAAASAEPSAGSAMVSAARSAANPVAAPTASSGAVAASSGAPTASSGAAPSK
jgi:hypothetical protein